MLKFHMREFFYYIESLMGLFLLSLIIGISIDIVFGAMYGVYVSAFIMILGFIGTIGNVLKVIFDFDKNV